MKNKIALVTGATGGIGRAAALEFARRGCHVAITGRRVEEGLKTKSMIEETGVKCIFIKSDVSQESECKRMVDETVTQLGGLHFAFNNAGIEGEMGPLVEAKDETFHKVMNINVLGVMNSMKYEIPAMIKSGGGSIVNNASVAAMIGMPGISIYAASKHAVLGLTKVAGVEYASQGVRVNCVSPGAIQTDMLDRFAGDTDEARDGLAAMHPIGRVGRSEEIATAVCFLCSDDSSFITGANLPIDGGMTVQ